MDRLDRTVCPTLEDQDGLYRDVLRLIAIRAGKEKRLTP